MPEQSCVQIGQFRQVTVWALFYVPEPDGAPAETSDRIADEPEPVVVWALGSDECHCERCWPTSDAACPKLAQVAREQTRRERELHAEHDLQLDRFEMPAYYTPAGRRNEVLRQVIARRDTTTDPATGTA